MTDIIDMLHDAQRLISECIETDKHSLIPDGLTLSSKALDIAAERIKLREEKLVSWRQKSGIGRKTVR